jgi:hypothetical protein
MINANNNTPASDRKKYMDVFGGKNNQDKDKSETTKVETPPQQNKMNLNQPKNLEEKINNKKIEPKNNPVNPVKKPKKIFGLDKKSVIAVASIALFFMFSMAGVLISLQQRMNPDQVAVPTAPKSKPAAAEIIETPDSGSCSLAFNIPEPSPSPTPSVSPSVSPSPSPTPSVSPSPSPDIYDCNTTCETDEQCQTANADYICSTEYNDLCRLDSNPESEICEPRENEYACNVSCETDEQCQTADSDYICSTEYDNNCRLDTNPSAENCQPEVSPSPSPSPTPTPTPSPSPSPVTYDCNSDCETNEQCESANADYTCSSTYGDKCRLDSNPASETCDTKPEEYACNSDCETNEQCETASSDYICYQDNCRLDSNPSAQNCQPTTYEPPVIGCNDTCVNNADCPNSEHICYNNACRLATNPSSSTCSIAQTTTYQTPVQTKGGQPALPAELPQSGSNAILDWLKAGLGVMGIGAVLLLLL